MRALVANPGLETKAELREAPEPEPGPGEALIEVIAISINRGELHRLNSAAEGWRPGWDVSGVVILPAADGSGPPAGTRVAAIVNGAGWAERVAVPTRQLAVLPEKVTHGAAAALPVAALTALRILGKGGRLLGRRVLITGASGGVGRFAIQLAAMAGARITAVVGGPGRAQGLEALGAEQVVMGIEAMAGLEPQDFVMESAGGPSLATALKRLRPGATLVTFGNSSWQDVVYQSTDFYFTHDAVIRGFTLFSDFPADPPARDLAFLLDLVAAGRLDPQVALELRWTDFATAFTALRDRRVAGKAVLHLG